MRKGGHIIYYPNWDFFGGEAFLGGSDTLV